MNAGIENDEKAAARPGSSPQTDATAPPHHPVGMGTCHGGRGGPWGTTTGGEQGPPPPSALFQQTRPARPTEQRCAVRLRDLHSLARRMDGEKQNHAPRHGGEARTASPAKIQTPTNRPPGYGATDHGILQPRCRPDRHKTRKRPKSKAHAHHLVTCRSLACPVLPPFGTQGRAGGDGSGGGSSRQPQRTPPPKKRVAAVPHTHKGGELRVGLTTCGSHPPKSRSWPCPG